MGMPESAANSNHRLGKDLLGLSTRHVPAGGADCLPSPFSGPSSKFACQGTHPGPNTQRQCPRLDNSPAAVGDMPSPPTALLSDHPEQHSPPRTQRRERACKFAGRGKTGIAHLPFTDSVVRSAKSEWWSESCVSAAPHVPRHLGTHTCRINPLSAPVPVPDRRRIVAWCPLDPRTRDGLRALGKDHRVFFVFISGRRRGHVAALPRCRPTPSRHARRTRMQPGAQGSSQRAANWHPAAPGAPR